MDNSWKDFTANAPKLAAFGEQRFKAGPAFLATVRTDGSPRVHPVTPIIGEGHLLLFMDATSPKGHDLQRDPRYALHCNVSDSSGGEGEFYVMGRAVLTDDPIRREIATKWGYQPKPTYILFELSVESAFSTVYESGSTVRQRWPTSDKSSE
jgi:hypothetical protein